MSIEFEEPEKRRTAAEHEHGKFEVKMLVMKSAFRLLMNQCNRPLLTRQIIMQDLQKMNKSDVIHACNHPQSEEHTTQGNEWKK